MKAIVLGGGVVAVSCAYFLARAGCILRFARDIFPDAADYGRGQYRACLRPMTPDGPPILGLGRHRNLYFNAGHGRMGWTWACGTGKIVADLMMGRMPHIDLDGLTAGRG